MSYVTISEYQVVQRRRDTPQEVHVWTSDLELAKSRAQTFSATDHSSIAYVMRGSEPVAYACGGIMLSRAEYLAAIGLAPETDL